MTLGRRNNLDNRRSSILTRDSESHKRFKSQKEMTDYTWQIFYKDNEKLINKMLGNLQSQPSRKEKEEIR